MILSSTVTTSGRVSISTHVLDTTLGQPAKGVAVSLERQSDATWVAVGSGETDDNGRLRTLTPDERPAPPATYRLVFDTGGYFASRGVQSFYPSVMVTFDAHGESGHYHVPLLLSPFGYSTYRGS